MHETLDAAALRSAMGSQGITQSQLVSRSGVSRPQLSRLLSKKTAPVRKSTVVRLAKGLGITPAELLVGGGLSEFRICLAEQHAKLDFRGMGMPQFERQPIEEIFVDLTVREVSELTDDCRPDRRESAQRQSSQPLSATECVRTQDRVIVLGHPGAGKTTLLRYLAHSYATGNGHQAELPIYIRLAEFGRAQELDDRVDLLKFVAARAVDHGCAEIEDSLRRELSDTNRRCLVLLDGLDEVGNHQQSEKLIQAVEALVQQYPTNRFVITSRVVGFASRSWTNLGFSLFRIWGYSHKQLRLFAEKWAGLLSRMQGRPYADVFEDLETAIHSNPRARAWASNPLILTILVVLSGARAGTLPRRRVDLYEKVVDVFLDTWETNKHATDKFDDTYSINLDAREFRWLLSDVSLAMQKAGRTLAPRWWLADKMRDYLQQKLGFDLDEANDVCDRIIRYLVERTGLMEEHGLDLFGFSQRTLQEYFASLGVIDEADATRSRSLTDSLQGFFFHPQWREVVRLVAAQLTPPLAESLVSNILDDPDPVGRFLKRGPLLALTCLSDGTTVANRRLISTIFDNLLDLGRSPWLGITLEAFDVLEDLDGTRLQCSAQKVIGTILATAQRELESGAFEWLRKRAQLREAFENSNGGPFEGWDTEAAREVSVTLDGTTHQVAFFNATMLLDHPDAWHKIAWMILADERRSIQLKHLLVRELGRRVYTDRRSRMRLRKILVSDGPVSLRVSSALALASASRGTHTKRLLTRVLRRDSDAQVRAACAAGLEEAAADDVVLCDTLTQFFEGQHPSAIRAGAARGLATVAAINPVVTESLLRHAIDETEADEVKISCAWALEPQIGENDKITEVFAAWLDATKPFTLRPIAAQCLATAMAAERVPWDHRVLEKAEHILMTLDKPCPHALASLEEIATAREVRGGLRLETILGDSLTPLGDRIDMAFVFGSTARNRQMEDSDIDLLIIGEIKLKDLSTPLRRAENSLGRRINPVIYTRESFSHKYQAGDPFLLDVYRREKIPVMRRAGDSSRKALDDELRAMVSERLASTI